MCVRICYPMTCVMLWLHLATLSTAWLNLNSIRSLYVYLHAFSVSGDIIVARPNIEAAGICWLLR